MTTREQWLSLAERSVVLERTDNLNALDLLNDFACALGWENPDHKRGDVTRWIDHNRRGYEVVPNFLERLEMMIWLICQTQPTWAFRLETKRTAKGVPTASTIIFGRVIPTVKVRLRAPCADKWVQEPMARALFAAFCQARAMAAKGGGDA